MTGPIGQAPAEEMDTKEAGEAADVAAPSFHSGAPGM